MELLLLSLLLLLLLLLLLIYFIKCDDTVAALLNPCQVVLEGILQPGSIPFTAPPFPPPAPTSSSYYGNSRKSQLLLLPLPPSPHIPLINCRDYTLSFGGSLAGSIHFRRY